MYFDPFYLVIIGAMMLASWLVSSSLKRKFRKYSQTTLGSGLSGREVAELMLRDNGISDVQVVSVGGQLTDHYNPGNKTVNLSPDVYQGRSAAAAAVAAHECGHALQHAQAYKWLEFRSAMVPVQNVSSRLLNIVFMLSLFGGFAMGMGFEIMMLIVIGAFAVTTAFSFVTLPVEFDASRRALAWIKNRGIVDPQEHGMAKDALDAAAKTYVVAALGSLAQLLYFVAIFLGGRE